LESALSLLACACLESFLSAWACFGSPGLGFSSPLLSPGFGAGLPSATWSFLSPFGGSPGLAWSFGGLFASACLPCSASFIAPISLFDEIEIEKQSRWIDFQCDDPSIPQGDENLVVRAAKAFFE